MSAEKTEVSRFRRWFGLGPAPTTAVEAEAASVSEEEASLPEELQIDLSADAPVEEVDKTLTEVLEEIDPELHEISEGEVPIEILEAMFDALEADPTTELVPEGLTEEPVEEVLPPTSAAVIEGSDGLTEAVPGGDAKPSKFTWFQRLTEGLRKSSQSLGTGITDIFTKRKLDADTLQDLEDILIQADLGVSAAARITEKVSAGRYDKEIEPEEVRRILAFEVAEVLRPVARPLEIDANHKPFVIMMVGVNGSGKTTTIGKLAARFRDEGRTVMLAAGDTFRAAAVEQLKVWGARVDAPVISRDIGADAAGLAFEALQMAKADAVDVLMIDTAGRLQNKSDLMAELSKVTRVLKKQDPTAPHAVLLVLDATTGQNAINQVEIFQKVAGVTGLVMTKLDGTARGGILVAVAERFGLPIHAIGVGESVGDLQPFEADAFARAISGLR